MRCASLLPVTLAATFCATAAIRSLASTVSLCHPGSPVQLCCCAHAAVRDPTAWVPSVPSCHNGQGQAFALLVAAHRNPDARSLDITGPLASPRVRSRLGQTPAAHVGSEQLESRFGRISKTPLHSQLAKPQHSNVTRDQVLLEQNMTFHINFHSASPFCRAQPGGVGGGEDRASHPACLCSFPGRGPWDPNSQAEQLPNAALLSCHLHLAQEQGRGLLPGCFLGPKTFCTCRSSSA